MPYDVLIAGGGPAGLSAALALGRARRRVLVCDAGERRNARAERIHNFVTRDGTPPDDFRRIARDQLAAYPSVEIRAERIASLSGTPGRFEAAVGSETVAAARVLLCTGMIDELPAIEGFADLWGHSIFQCPYCHGWEIQDRRWGYLPRATEPGHVLPFALQARAWTGDVVVFTGGAIALPAEARTRLTDAGIRIETAPLVRLVGRGGQLEAIALADGSVVARDVLFTHPPQRHVDLVVRLGVSLDDDGFVRVDGQRQTSVPGVYAAGDLTTRMQGAIHAAAAGTQAAAMINVDLAMDPAAGRAR